MTDSKDDDREEKFRVMSREKALAVLIEVTDTLDSTGNVYWLSDGTLLGLVREGDFIAHDDDIDIVVLASSFNPEAIHQLIAKGFVVNQLFGALEKGFGLTMRRDGIRVDWFMCYEKDGQHVYSIFQQISRHRGQRLDYQQVERRGPRQRRVAGVDALVTNFMSRKIQKPTQKHSMVLIGKCPTRPGTHSSTLITSSIVESL